MRRVLEGIGIQNIPPYDTRIQKNREIGKQGYKYIGKQGYKCIGKQGYKYIGKHGSQRSRHL